jgi:hypothetical protein
VYRAVELDAFDCARLFVTIRVEEPAGFFASALDAARDDMASLCSMRDRRAPGGV